MITIPFSPHYQPLALVVSLWSPAGRIVLCARTATFYRDAMHPPDATCISLWDVTFPAALLQELVRVYGSPQLTPPCLRVAGRRFNRPQFKYHTGYHGRDGMVTNGTLTFVGYEEVEDGPANN